MGTGPGGSVGPHPANTFDAHRLLHMAAETADEPALLAAHFAERRVLSDHETLVAAAAEAGLDAQRAERVLRADAYGAEVRAGARESAALGIHSVPFFVLDRRYAIPGAQPAGVIRDALDGAWTARLSQT